MLFDRTRFFVACQLSSVSLLLHLGLGLIANQNVQQNWSFSLSIERKRKGAKAVCSTNTNVVKRQQFLGIKVSSPATRFMLMKNLSEPASEESSVWSLNKFPKC